MPTADLLDLSPRSSIVWPIQNLRKPSDHAPIFLTLHPLLEKPETPTMPTCIAIHGKFRETLDRLSIQMSCPRTPHEALGDQILGEARCLLYKGPPSEKVSCCTKLLRASRDGRTESCRKVVKAYCFLEKFYSVANDDWVDIAGFHLLRSTLIRE
eukprot:8684982-Pyramimonas_sp.AAC.1